MPTSPIPEPAWLAPINVRWLLSTQCLVGGGWLGAGLKNAAADPIWSAVHTVFGIAVLAAGLGLFTRTYFALGLTAVLNAFGCAAVYGMAIRPPTEDRPGGFGPGGSELYHVMLFASVVLFPLAIAEVYRLYKCKERQDAWHGAGEDTPPLPPARR